MPADPLRSEGARLERKAVREYLRRKLARMGKEHDGSVNEVLAWMLAREKRYSKRPGGL